LTGAPVSPAISGPDAVGLASEEDQNVSERPRLEATSRAESGKSAAARLRHGGRLPAVLFGHGIESQSLSLDMHELARLRRHVGATTLVDLTVDGRPANAVLIHGVQIHKVTHEPVHVDLFAVRMTEELTAEVPLVPQGVSPASEAGGTLVHPVSSVKVRALPEDLPESIHYDLSSLTDYEHVLTVADLVAPHGVTIHTDPSELIARVLAPRVEETPVGAEAPVEAPAETAETTTGEG
jgi:large subunit ribosomal protein L25